MRLEPSGVVRGAIAGTLATAPMTLLMEAGYRLLPREQRYPLPPREILEELAHKAHAPLPEQEEQRLSLTLAAHFAYGMAGGALYGLASPPSLAAGAIRGSLYGVAIWLLSYLGWLPAFRVLRPATEHPPQRTALMIAAHLVWGASVGMLTYRARRH